MFWDTEETRRAKAARKAYIKNMTDARLGACDVCPYIRKGWEGRRCKLCQCFVAIKAKIPSQQCPAGYWRI